MSNQVKVDVEMAKLKEKSRWWKISRIWNWNPTFTDTKLKSNLISGLNWKFKYLNDVSLIYHVTTDTILNSLKVMENGKFLLRFLDLF